MKQIDWSAIYEMLRRIRPSLVQFQHRITNALEEGRLREVQQAYAPDPRYYIAARGFTPSAEIGVYSQPYVQFLHDDLRRRFPQFFTPDFAHVILPGIQLLGETLMLYPSPIDLVQTFDLVGDHQNRPLAIRSKLIPNDLEIRERCDFRFHYLFAHNNSALSAIHSVAEGVVRPSASDPHDSTWIPANSFLCTWTTD